MALTKQIMGSSLLERSMFVPSSSPSSLLNQTRFLVPLENKRVVRMKRAAKFPVAAISEDLMKGSSSSPSSSSSSSSVSTEKPVKFKVRAVITVRNKIKEDFKETIVKHIDALTDRIGRNVVLELVSTEIDPSKTFSYEKTTSFPKPSSQPTQYFFLLKGCATIPQMVLISSKVTFFPSPSEKVSCFGMLQSSTYKIT